MSHWDLAIAIKLFKIGQNIIVDLKSSVLPT